MVPLIYWPIPIYSALHETSQLLDCSAPRGHFSVASLKMIVGKRGKFELLSTIQISNV